MVFSMSNLHPGLFSISSKFSFNLFTSDASTDNFHVSGLVASFYGFIPVYVEWLM